MIRAQSLLLVPMGLALVFSQLTGCSFDESGLTARLCSSTNECGSGQVCIDGACQSDSIADGGATDGGFDSGADVIDNDVDDGPDVLECTPGDARCSENLLITCSDQGRLITTNCSSESTCPDAALGCSCVVDACVERICTPGRTACADDSTISQCDATGTSLETIETCDDDETCVGGACIPTDCEAGTVSCSGETVVNCGDDGLIRSTTDCSAQSSYCMEAAGTATCEPWICVPLNTSCNDESDAVITCNDRGSEFESIEACNAGEFCRDGVCTDQLCVPETVRCADGRTLALCDELGGNETEEECEAGLYCQPGPEGASCEPQICTPGAARCLEGGESLEVCNEFGSGFEFASACDASEFCAEGECRDQVCTPDSLSCDGFFAIATCDPRGSSSSTEACGDGTYCLAGDGTAECERQVCEPSTFRCTDDGREVCNEQGAAYEPADACDVGFTCVDGDCEEQICVPDTATCADDFTVGLCDTSGLSTTDTPCAADEYCEAGECETQVCTPDSATCSDDFTVTACDSRGSSLSDIPCAGDEYCDSGTCVEQACVPDSQVCTDDFTATTCDSTGSSFTSVACNPGEYCDAGSCTPQVCEPGGTVCSGPVIVAQCNDIGSAETFINCPDGLFCNEGTCTARICEPSTRTCVDTVTVEVCNADGTSRTTETCDAGDVCVAGNCRAEVCAADSEFCTDDFTRAVCNDSGTAFTETVCGAGEYCDAGACAPQVCVPDELSCADATTVSVCDSIGSSTSELACASDQICDAGMCVPQVCEPAMAYCDGSDVRQCNGDGTASTFVESCTFSCDAGACRPAVCGDGIVTASNGEECDDGNEDPCDGCDSCQFARAMSFTSVTQRSSGGAWAPEENDFTIEFWVNATSPGYVMGLGSAGGDYVTAEIRPGGTMRFEFDLGSSQVVLAEGSTNLLDGAWHHVALVRFDTSAGMVFVDGIVEGMAWPNHSNTSIDGDGVIWFGSNGTRSGASALIDEVHIASQALYTGAFTPSRTALTGASSIAHYDMNSNDLSTLTDSGSARNVALSATSSVADACYGAPDDSRECGDGVLAPWETCEAGDARCTSCEYECPDITGPFRNCYATRSGGANYADTEAGCREGGLELVTLETPLEDLWVWAFLNEADTWIGLSDRGDEGDFQWGSDATSGYRNWGGGEPNDGGFGPSEDCVEQLHGSFDWNDNRCGRSRRQLCEE